MWILEHNCDKWCEKLSNSAVNNTVNGFVNYATIVHFHQYNDYGKMETVNQYFACLMTR